MVDQHTTARWMGVDYADDADKFAGRGYVLRESLASKQQGRPVYFQMQTRIGPCHTSNQRDAHRFPTEHDARTCPAYAHPLCHYVVEPAPEVPHG